MADVEFLEKRIEGKAKEIAKLEKKLERIRKAEATNWENNPYWYSESDLRSTQRELDSAKKQLEDYRQSLATEEEKANSRNIPTIIEFLDNWYNRSLEYYKQQRVEYLEALELYTTLRKQASDWINKNWSLNLSDEYKERYKMFDDLKKEFYSKWNHVKQFEKATMSWDESLEKELKQEYNRKYDFIIERTNEIVGQITDTSYLTINNQELNGVIIGTRGKASVNTIGAGGYNIQCFHFRTLIKKIEAKDDKSRRILNEI